MWYKISDFNLFNEESYIYQLLKSEWEIPFISVVWKVNNGNFVKKGDCLFTCYVNNKINNYYHTDICIFNSPSDGYVLRKYAQEIAFGCRHNTPICAIYNTFNEYENALKLFSNEITDNDYVNYILIKNDYNIRYYCHPSKNSSEGKIQSILSWFTSGKHIISSYGKNKNGMLSSIYINNDYTIDCIADYIGIVVDKRNSLPKNIRFQKVSGDFSISFYNENNSEMSLKGCPQLVGGNFVCEKFYGLNLIGSPTFINGDYIINGIFETYEGFPKRISGKTKINIKKTRDTKPQVLYLMFDTSNNAYKIGISKHPKDRERTLQSDKPSIGLFKVYVPKGNETAYGIEQYLHRKYAHKQWKREDKKISEWFALTEDDMKELLSLYDWKDITEI